MTAFRALTGHEKIKKSLTGAIVSNRVSHAYLFYGPPGVGKRTAGMAFARALLCSGGGGDACEVCDECSRSKQGVHPDLHLIRPDGASIKIRQLRELCDGAVFTSFSEGRQVFLVEQADRMTTEAANSFLKTLEEPMTGVVFILITDELTGIPPTVLSRCLCYRFNNLSRADVTKVIMQEAGSAELAHTMAVLSGGSPGRALALLGGSAGRDRALEMALSLAVNSRSAMPVPPEEISGREGAQEFVNYLTVLFRDVMVVQQTGVGELLINIDRQDDIAVLAGAYDRREVLDILLTAEETARRLAGNVNQRLALDSLLLKIAGF
ncbi:MAG: DNA polymerase III subunit delta' [Desulfotomaculaceae bacterium]